MARGNVTVRGPYEGLYYIKNDDFHVCRRADDPGDWPEIRLLRDIDYAEVTGGEWLYDDEGTGNELEDILECFSADFSGM